MSCLLDFDVHPPYRSTGTGDTLPYRLNGTARYGTCSFRVIKCNKVVEFALTMDYVPKNVEIVKTAGVDGRWYNVGKMDRKYKRFSGKISHLEASYPSFRGFSEG